MVIKHKSQDETYLLSATFGKYPNGQNSIKLNDCEDGFPFATATLCVEDELLKPDEVAIKDYSENVGILESLIDAEIIDYPHAFIWTGHVRIPICKLIVKK